MDNFKIKEMQKIARRKGGKCISQIYVNSKTNLLWECAQGHRWEATPNNVKRGTWCGKCAGKTKLTIQEMQKLAIKHGGNCLSNTYVNKDRKLLWECAEGHRWKAIPGSVKRGSWCRRCAGTEKGSIDEMSQIAETRDGKCLSKVYENSKTKLLWECAEGHRWWASPGNIKNRGSWCNVCGAKIKAHNRKLGIDKMHSIAKERGGKCLSEEYINSENKLLWECGVGHHWEAMPKEIIRGRWCPNCSSGLGERICREFFEQLFGKKFIKSYPKWLTNNRGNQMELDGFCQNLKLAFEHHGRQHYTSDTIFYKSDKDLKVRQELDEQKKMLCKKNRITLIEVPEIPTMLPIEGVKIFIKMECKKRGVSLPIDYDKREIKLQKALINLAAKEALSELKKIAQGHGGKCLSNTYMNAFTKLKWECAEGHQWQAPPNRIKNGHWCNECGIKLGAAKRMGDIIEMRNIAKKRRGKCLSKKYVDSSTKLIWECSIGHIWEAAPRDIKSGHWCKKCGHENNAKSRRLGIEKMHSIVKDRGGKCLSKIYANNKTKLLWECAIGHKWEATPSNVMRGSWCPTCYKAKKSS